MTATTHAAGTVVRDGFRLRWVREGEGAPLLVIGSAVYYRRTLPASLRRHFTAVFCDLRHFVASPADYDLDRITRDAYSQDVEAVAAAAGLDRPLVLGHSVHGTIALEYAARYPDRVRGVVPIAAVAPADPRLETPDDFFRRDASAARLAAHERNRATRRIPALVETARDFVDSYVLDDAKTWFDPTFDSSSLFTGVQANVAVFNHLWTPAMYGAYEVPCLDLPVFLALGRYDYRIPHYLWDEPKKRLRHLHDKLYGESGHDPSYEQPEEFAADLGEWVGNL